MVVQTQKKKFAKISIQQKCCDLKMWLVSCRPSQGTFFCGSKKAFAGKDTFKHTKARVSRRKNDAISHLDSKKNVLKKSGHLKRLFYLRQKTIVEKKYYLQCYKLQKICIIQAYPKLYFRKNTFWFEDEKAVSQRN